LRLAATQSDACPDYIITAKFPNSSF